MSKQEEAGLILKLFELRRDETLRKARDWYVMEFHPQSAADVDAAMFGPNGVYLRMVTSYWEMAASLVNNGAISSKMFNDANGEHIGVFGKLEPHLADLRKLYGPEMLGNLEKLIDSSEGGRDRVAAMREMMKGIMARLASQASGAANA